MNAAQPPTLYGQLYHKDTEPTLPPKGSIVYIVEAKLGEKLYSLPT